MAPERDVERAADLQRCGARNDDWYVAWRSTEGTRAWPIGRPLRLEGGAPPQRGATSGGDERPLSAPVRGAVRARGVGGSAGLPEIRLDVRRRRWMSGGVRARLLAAGAARVRGGSAAARPAPQRGDAPTRAPLHRVLAVRSLAPMLCALLFGACDSHDTGSGLDAGANTADAEIRVNVPGRHDHVLAVDGVERRAAVHVGGGAAGRDAPVVIMFHGTTGDGESVYDASGWREEAEAGGFIAVFTK